MNFFLFLNDQDIREKVTFALESTFGATVIEASDRRQANAFLTDSKNQFDLIICGAEDALNPRALVLPTAIKKTPTILVTHKTQSRFDDSWQVKAVLAPNNLLSQLITTVTELKKMGVITENSSQPQEESDFCRIKTKLLLAVFPLKADIFIRLSKVKYIKLFLEGDAFDANDLDKYTIKKGVVYLYIQKNDIKEFIEKYNEDLQKYMKPSYQLTVTEMIDLNEQIHETLHELGAKVGFTPEVQTLVRTHVRMTVKSIGKMPTLSVIVNRLEKFKGKYIYAHSMMAGYIGCAIALRMEWGSDSTFQKLSYASILHDITLDNHELADCVSVEEAKNRGFTKKEVDDFQAHPTAAASLIAKFPEIPPDVDTVLAQHHEKPDGTGFPRKLSGRYIAPLAAVFIIAHDLSRVFIKKGTEADIEKVKQEIAASYSSSHFKKVVAALMQL